MFSFAKTAAISAIFLSTSLGVAFAGSHGDPSHEHGEHHGDGGSPQSSFLRGDDDITTDATPSPIMVAPAYTSAHVYRPRLETILTELRADSRSMNADRDRGLLTGAQYQQLKAEDMHIRREAISVADRNNGAIPAARYAALQNEANHLQTDIRRMA